MSTLNFVIFTDVTQLQISCKEKKIHLNKLKYYSDIPPSQGGKYSGFGYTKEAPPRSQSQEFVDTAFSSLSSVRSHTAKIVKCY